MFGRTDVIGPPGQKLSKPTATILSLTHKHTIIQTLAAKVPIILLILSFAYLSISLDISGFFKAAATYVVGLARGNGHRLLIYVYLLCSALTYVASNDIVILSMTPLLMHVGDCSSIRDAVPLLVTQYIAANTASMGLLVGSPTNIILGEGVGLGALDAHMVVCDPTSYRSIDHVNQTHQTGDAIKLSFARYWVLMLLPTFVAIASTLTMVLVVFVYLPTRGHCMPRHFTMLAPGGETPPTPYVVEGCVEKRDGGALELTRPPSATMAVSRSSRRRPPCRDRGRRNTTTMTKRSRRGRLGPHPMRR